MPRDWQPVSPLKSVKNEVHNILQLLQLTQYSTTRRFSREIQSTRDPPLIRRFRSLLRRLSAINQFETTLSTVQPFLDVIVDPQTPAPITAVVLAAINKFVTYNLVRVDRPGAAATINHIAHAILSCRFQSTNSQADEVVSLKILTAIIDTLRCPAGELLDDSNIWGMIKRCFQINRQAGSSHLLRSSSENTLQQVVLKIFATSTPHATDTDDVEDDVRDDVRATDDVRVTGPPFGEVSQCKCLRFLAFLISYGSSPSNVRGNNISRAKFSALHSPPLPSGASLTASTEASSTLLAFPNVSEEMCSPRKEQTIEGELMSIARQSGNESESVKLETRSLGLTLLNVALETAGKDMTRSAEVVVVIQEHVCKALLRNAQTCSLMVLSMTLRSIFNLFMYSKKHLKVQLELFFSSLHLQVAGEVTCKPSSKKYKTDQVKMYLHSCEKRELALESILEFCREPDLILELYENYDCDVRCTNLFENLMKTLSSSARPKLAPHQLDDQPQPADSLQAIFHTSPLVSESMLINHKLGMPFRKTLGRVTALHKLALAGLTAVCQNLAMRCVWDTRGPFLRPDGDEEKLEGLKHQKDYKRRLATGAKIFNTEPSRSLSALQNLGLIPTPATEDAMAEFLRTTAGLDLCVVGEYLAKKDDWNYAVCRKFADQINFGGVPVVEALRMFLGCFRLPGESQQIERVVESFAGAYFVQQAAVLEAAIIEPSSDPRSQPLPLAQRTPRWIPPENIDHKERLPFRQWSACKEDSPPFPECTIFRTSDTVFVLSYSIIMLNTDLHNVIVKRKMSPEDFARMNRGINDNADLPADYCASIYQSIKEDEIKIVASSASTNIASLVVENREFWDYLLSNSDFLGDYSSTLAVAQIRTPLQAFHQRSMFLTLWDDAHVLETLLSVFCCTRDPHTAIECIAAIGDIIRIASFYKESEILTDIASILLNYCQPVFSFKCQLVIPLMLNLLKLANDHLGLRGWLVFCEFLTRLALIGLLPGPWTDFERFPISPRDVQVLDQCFSCPTLRPPGKPENLAKLQQMPSSSWLTEFTALFWTGSDSQLEATDNPPSEDSDAEESFGLIVGDGKKAWSIHQRALKASLEFWQNSTYFSASMTPDSIGRLQIPSTQLLTTTQALDSFHTIFVTRCPPDEVFLSRIRELPDSGVISLTAALLMRLLPPSNRPPAEQPSPQSSNEVEESPSVEDSPPVIDEDDDSPLGELRRMISSPLRTSTTINSHAIQFTFRRDDAPLLKTNVNAQNHFVANYAPASSLEMLGQLILMLDKRRENDGSQLFFVVYQHSVMLIEKLLSRFALPSEIVVTSGVAEKPLSSYFTEMDTETHARPLELVLECAFKELDENETLPDPSIDSFFVERVVVTALKLCNGLGHHRDTRILAPLVRFFDLICRLQDVYFYRLYFQIASAVSLLLNCAVFGQGLHDVDDLFHEPNSSQRVALPSFHLSLIDLIQRVSPHVLQVVAATNDLLPATKNAQLQSRMSQSGAELLCTVATSSDFHAILHRMLRRGTQSHQRRSAPFCVPFFTRYLTQTFLLYCLPSTPPEFTVANFDLDEPASPVPSPEPLPSAMAEHILTLLPALYAGVCAPELPQPAAADDHTPSTNDAESCVTVDSPPEVEDLWDLWAPIAQALSIVSAFGSRRLRRPAMMNLQHHLGAMPVAVRDQDDPTPRNGRRWAEVVEFILFPLMSHTFVYPFPSSTSRPEAPKSHHMNLGQTLLLLFPQYDMVLCRIPRQDLIRQVIDPISSSFGNLPKHIVMQRKAQSVGFVCRALLGKLDILFEPVGWDDEFVPLCLLPTVLRVLRVFLHEMHGANTAMFDAIVEASKNFLLVMATSSFINLLTEKEAYCVLGALLRQDPSTLLPTAQKPSETAALAADIESVEEAYAASCSQYVPSLSESQRLLFLVVYHLLHLADRTGVLTSVFEVLVPSNKRIATSSSIVDSQQPTAA